MLKGYSEEDLVGLSAAERAILEGDDDNDGEGSEDELSALAGDDGEDGSDDGDAGSDTDDAEDDGDGDGADKDKGKEGVEGAEGGDDKGKGGEKPAKTGDKADKPKTGETDEDVGVDTGVNFAPQTPADAQKQRDDLNTRKDEAFTKLMDGEIDAAEYKKVEKEVDGKLQELLQATITDNVTSTLTQANIAKAWKTEVSTALKAAAADGIDYAKDEAKTKELDRLIRVFGNEAAESGMTDDGLKASKWALAQALDTMKRRYGKETPAPGAKAGAKPAGSRAGEKPDLSNVPPGLSKAPIASGAPGGADEFAHLNGMKGAALEKAIAKMTPEQQDRYLA
ncbi:hypothetical protein D9M73_70820 [compost metagenome]